MGFTESSRYCNNCKRHVLVRQETPNHTVHVLITLLSCGLWGIVWLALTLMGLGNPWRCTVCGRPTNAASTSTLSAGFRPSTLPTGFRPLQPARSSFIGTIRNDLKRGDYSKVVLIGTVVVCLFAILTVPKLLKSKANNSKTVYTPSDIAARKTPQTAPTVKPPSPTPSKVPSPTPDSDGFNTDRSKQILAAFFIKPVLQSMLNNPDSLQDLEVISVVPSKKMSGVYRATASYRAENGFGALVYQQQDFMITKGTGTGLDAWRVTPLKD